MTLKESFMSQYFVNDHNVRSNIKEIEFKVNGRLYNLLTDNGVFSKSRVDYGSLHFLEIILKEKLQGRGLDIGCGYGTIGLVLASLIEETLIEMVDVNERALKLATMNQERLNLDNVKIYQSDIFSKVEGEFDYIVTNPPIRAGKKVVYAIFEQSYSHLKENGSLYFVIRKDQGAASAQKKVEEIFSNCTLLKRDKGYYIYRATKYSKIA